MYIDPNKTVLSRIDVYEAPLEEVVASHEALRVITEVLRQALVDLRWHPYDEVRQRNAEDAFLAARRALYPHQSQSTSVRFDTP